MSDLISRSALIKQIVNRTGSETVLFNSTEELNAYLTGCAYKQNQIIDMVMNQPTAYNLEDVTEQLENLSSADADYTLAEDLVDRKSVLAIVRCNKETNE